MYDHRAIDKKWQNRWEDEGIFHAEDFSAKEPYYLLIEFPFPSGAGLHVGHPRSYTALDVVARKRRMQGYNVLYPIGWDAFGLPTENFAIKTGRPPAEVTAANIATFKRQLRALGLSFDWSREISTTDPGYYKWTQWQFLQFFKKGLAYKAKTEINWCPSCKIGLANEEATGGVCERCGGPVEKREKEQWMIAITKYAERLLSDLDTVDYLPKVKKQQEDWIGKSEGAEIDFQVAGSEEKLTVFTTRPDTIFGATFLVIAPEHKLLSNNSSDEVRDYIASTLKKTDIERGDDTKEKTGVFTGMYAVNPMTNEQIPIWTSDYVLPHYGTGAIMAVPAHDVRDNGFVTEMGLRFPQLEIPRQVVVLGPHMTEGDFGFGYDGEGIMINSGEFNGLDSTQARNAITDTLEARGVGKKATKYKLRDWVFSRQRYWGEPIPLVHCEKDGWVAVPDEQLPVVLPEVEAYQPTENGESPLATIESFVNTTCPTCAGPAKRETDTMPNWAGSSWYFLRYADPKNENAFADRAKLNYWTPVDWYNGGMEHTTLHLLYSRFWHKFLYDEGLVPTSEPYSKRTSHGLILAEDGTKMSKSKGNVVNPDEIVQEFGADTLRVYELFIGQFSEPAPWSQNGVVGVKRFLDRVMRLPELVKEKQSDHVSRALHKMMKKVGEDIEAMRFNTAVAEMMSFVNVVNEQGGIQKTSLQMFLQVLCPFAPHVASETFEKIGGSGILDAKTWPAYDEKLLVADEMEIAVQVNGKLRGSVTVKTGTAKEEILALAKAHENVAKHLTGEPKKEIYIEGKLINFVI